MHVKHMHREAWAPCIFAARITNMNDAHAALALAIREAIESSPLTQEKISEQSGISQSMLSRIQNAQTSVTTERLALLAATIGTTPSALWKRAEIIDEQGIAPAPPARKSAPTKSQKQIEVIEGVMYAIVAGVSEPESTEAEAILRSLKQYQSRLPAPDPLVSGLISAMESGLKKRRGRRKPRD